MKKKCIIYNHLTHRGFSLVELMIVVAIIGILIAVLLPELGDMANRSRISSAQRSMDAIRDAIIRYKAEEGRELKELSWLVPKYMTEIKRDPWGNPYTIIPLDGVIISAGPDGKLNTSNSSDPVNRDNIVVSYFPPLTISDAQITVDINGNNLIDNGDIITIYLTRAPLTPPSANSAGNDFVFLNKYEHDGTDQIIPHTNPNATDDTNLGTLTTIKPNSNASTDGELGGKWTLVNLRVNRDANQNSSFKSNLFVRFDDTGPIDGNLTGSPANTGGCFDPNGGNTTYRDKRGAIARNPDNYNVRIKKPGEM